MNVVDIIHKTYIYKQINTCSLKLSWWLCNKVIWGYQPHSHSQLPKTTLLPVHTLLPCWFFRPFAC